MHKKNLIPIISLFFLFKSAFTIFGIVLYHLDIPWPDYLKILFGDGSLYQASILIPIIFLILYTITAMLLSLQSKTAWLMAILLLIIDLFYYPVGTAVSLMFIILLLTPFVTEHLKPFPKKKAYFRIAGITLLSITLGFFLVNTGLAENIMNRIIPPPLIIKPPEEKITSIPSSIPREPNEWIVVLSGSLLQAAMQQETLIIYAQSLGCNILKRYTRVLNAITICATEKQVYELAKNPNVKYVFPNIIIPLADYETSEKPCLADVHHILNIDPLWAAGVTGEGITVAVVDTGINEDMKWLQRNGQSIVVESYEIFADYIHPHGTEVASCVASQNETYPGIAPDANLLDVEVFTMVDTPEGPQPGAPTDAILEGWDWVANWKEATGNFVICTNSFGSPYELAFCGGWKNPCPLCLAANNMVQTYNIPMVIAAGNYDLQYGLELNCPGQAQYAITVGAVDDELNIAWWSCRGPTSDGNKKPDVVAPGVAIHTFDDQGNLVIVDGTSFSTPEVAGVVALLAQGNENYDAIQFKRAIQKSAKDLGTWGFDYDYGYGLVDAYKALQTLKSGNPPITWQQITIALSAASLGVIFYPEIETTWRKRTI